MNRRIIVVVAVLLLALGAPLASLGEDPSPEGVPSLAFAGGDGSPGNPFLISNVSELQNMSANLTAHYRLAGDIDASPTLDWNGGAGFAPVGSVASKFNGSLDGDGHTISDLVIDRPGQDYVGLFGYLEEAEVHDLELEDASIEGRDRVGTLCGECTSGSIANCSASGTVRGQYYVGGLSGVVGGALNDSATDVSLSGSRWVGGLVGFCTGAVARCSSQGRLSSTFGSVGGLIGYIGPGGTLSHGHSKVTVLVVEGYSPYQVGGLVGCSEGTLTHCVCEGMVIVVPDHWYIHYVGGLIGANYGSAYYCRSLGSVMVKVTNEREMQIMLVGGFAGLNRGTIMHSLSEAPLTVEGSGVGVPGRELTINYVGGFTGLNGGTMAFCYSTGACTVNGRTGRDCHINHVGGLSGNNAETISDCYSTSDVICTAVSDNARVFYCGGLVGSAWSSVSHCYSTGSVTATAVGNFALTGRIGGLLGYTDEVSTACFWDVQTSGTTTGVGSGTTEGTSGNTTAEMKTRATFADAGWDMDDTWLMIEDVTYPCLHGIYHRPVVDMAEGLVHAEDAPLVLPAEVTVSDYPRANREISVTYTSDAGPWLYWNGTRRAFTGTPGNAEVGTYWLNLTARDRCGFTGFANVTFTVANVNDDPVITTTDVTSATEDEPYSVAYGATDVDPTGDTLSWSLDTLAGWLVMDNDTGLLEGTPGNDDVGTHRVTVGVTDGHGGADATTFSLTVENVNDDPVITTTALETAVEDAGYHAYYHAYDVDPTDDTLEWHLTTDAAWLSMEGDHLFGVPVNDDVGTHSVNVTVTDGRGGMASRVFDLRVLNVNDPPVIGTDHVTKATEDEEYSVDYEAADGDPTDDQLEWSLVTGATWLSIDGTWGVLSGTPSNDDVGTLAVTVRVVDGNGGVDEGTFLLTVADVNDDPVITTEADETAMEDQAYLLPLAATDVDPGGDTLAWSLDTDASWLELEGDALAGVPDNDDVGDHPVTVTVTDGRGGSDTLEFTLTVSNTNDPPAIVNAPTDAVEEEPYSFVMQAEDVDAGDEVRWWLEPTGLWLMVDPVTGELTGTPADGDVGPFSVVITVSDGIATVPKTFTIEVANVNDAPEWRTPPDDVELEHGTPLSMGLEAVDRDGDALRYSVAADPAAEGLTIASVSGELAWPEPRPGTYVVTVTASDGEEAVDATFDLVVKKAQKEDEGTGNAPLYAAIAVLLVAVVLLLLWTVMGGARAERAPGDRAPEEVPTDERPGGAGAEEESTDDEGVDGKGEG